MFFDARRRYCLLHALHVLLAGYCLLHALHVLLAAYRCMPHVLAACRCL
jgi:hypothetical protein